MERQFRLSNLSPSLVSPLCSFGRSAFSRVSPLLCLQASLLSGIPSAGRPAFPRVSPLLCRQARLPFPSSRFIEPRFTTRNPIAIYTGPRLARNGILRIMKPGYSTRAILMNVLAATHPQSFKMGDRRGREEGGGEERVSGIGRELGGRRERTMSHLTLSVERG